MLNPATHRSAPGAGARATRLVDRLVIRGAPVPFRELCRSAVPRETRYLVLDLDRTVHLGRNMGELLGWELCACRGYGLDRLLEAEPRRTPGRFFFDWSRPASVLRYLAVTARMWAAPGLFYLVFGKLPAHLELARRLSYRRFGPDPVSAVQRLPQLVLMHHLARLPASTLGVLARRVWERYAGDQVIERDDLAWLRARCPELRIVMTSASPRPVLDVAAEALGVDDVIYTAVEEHAGRFSSPYELNRLLQPGEPDRISGPGQVRINSGRAKMRALLARYPELAAGGVVSVGMSDTGYGEDHCWAEHLTRVVAVNSTAPFPPIVPAASPVREIHSAAVLTRSERARRAGGEPAYLDARRAPRPADDVALGAVELAASIGPIADEVERLACRFREQADALRAPRRRAAEEVEHAAAALDRLAAAFNAAERPERGRILARLRAELRGYRALRRRLARVDRPLSAIAVRLEALLAGASRLAADATR